MYSVFLSGHTLTTVAEPQDAEIAITSGFIKDTHHPGHLRTATGSNATPRSASSQGSSRAVSVSALQDVDMATTTGSTNPPCPPTLSEPDFNDNAAPQENSSAASTSERRGTNAAVTNGSKKSSNSRAKPRKAPRSKAASRNAALHVNPGEASRLECQDVNASSATGSTDASHLAQSQGALSGTEASQENSSVACISKPQDAIPAFTNGSKKVSRPRPRSKRATGGNAPPQTATPQESPRAVTVSQHQSANAATTNGCIPITCPPPQPEGIPGNNVTPSSTPRQENLSPGTTANASEQAPQPSLEVLELQRQIKKLEERNLIVVRERDHFKTMMGWWHLPDPKTGNTRLDNLKEENRKMQLGLGQLSRKGGGANMLKDEIERLKKNVDNWKDIARGWRMRYQNTREGRRQLGTAVPPLESILIRQRNGAHTIPPAAVPLISHSDSQPIDLTEEPDHSTAPETGSTSNPRKRRRGRDETQEMAAQPHTNGLAPSVNDSNGHTALQDEQLERDLFECESEASDGTDDLERALLDAFAEEDMANNRSRH